MIASAPLTVRAHILRRVAKEIPSEYASIELDPSYRASIYEASSTAYIHGPPGTGKTAQAWALYRIRRCAEYAEAYGLALLDEPCEIRLRADTYDSSATHRDVVVNGAIVGNAEIRNKSAKIISEPCSILRHRYDRGWLDEVTWFPGLLTIDDIGCVPVSDWVIESIYTIANERRAHELRTAYSSNLTPTELATKYSPAISSRLCGGSICEMAGRDRRHGETA